MVPNEAQRGLDSESGSLSRKAQSLIRPTPQLFYARFRVSR